MVLVESLSICNPQVPGFASEQQQHRLICHKATIWKWHQLKTMCAALHYCWAASALRVKLQGNWPLSLTLNVSADHAPECMENMWQKEEFECQEGIFKLCATATAPESNCPNYLAACQWHCCCPNWNFVSTPHNTMSGCIQGLQVVQNTYVTKVEP